MNAFDKLQFWFALAAVILLLGGLAAALFAYNFVLGAVLLVAGLICGGVSKAAIQARQQTAQNALIRRK